VKRRGKGPARPLRGEITVPGDKSISHRAVLLSTCAAGSSTIVGVAGGDDVAATLDAAEALGVSVSRDEDNSQVKLESRGLGKLGEPSRTLDVRNSGTSARCLAGLCATVDAASVIDGDASLRARPMLRVVAPLRQMGATIDGRDHGNLLPLSIRGGRLEGLSVELPVASAQVKTALLLAGLHAEGKTEVTEPGASRDHTERMLAAAGVDVERTSKPAPGHGGPTHTVSVEGGARPEARPWRVPGDLSSALYLIVAALLVPGSEVTVADVGLNPTRTAALDVLARMGADLSWDVEDGWGGEPVGTVRARSSELGPFSIGPEEVPGLIDELPILAVAAARATGSSEVSGAAELRVKESDRIEGIVEGMRAMGVEAEARPDGFAILGTDRFAGAVIEPRNDHRIALSFAVAGLVASDNVKVLSWSCTASSFPEFLDVLGSAQGGS
jgi:3-phosphoshikimate 1-carboxyvinyltransferase